ncbi:MAG: hypothetical protein GTO30_12875, partial [Acidobacteria bacterium]|nr:hypothetical protein [Acidobacteriota bacterium]NIQ86244.1 hypothetical protein [Acidobacteriota bacterium]
RFFTDKDARVTGSAIRGQHTPGETVDGKSFKVLDVARINDQSRQTIESYVSVDTANGFTDASRGFSVPDFDQDQPFDTATACPTAGRIALIQKGGQFYRRDENCTDTLVGAGGIEKLRSMPSDCQVAPGVANANVVWGGGGGASYVGPIAPPGHILTSSGVG